MMNPRRQFASQVTAQVALQAVRSALAALPLVMIALFQTASANAAPAAAHDDDRDHRDGRISRWDFDCEFGYHDRRYERCEAWAVVYGVDEGFPAPAGGKEPEIPVTPIVPVPVPVPISPNRLAVWCDGVGLIYDNAADVANDWDFASVSGFGGTPAVVFDLDDHHSLKSVLEEDGDDDDHHRDRIDAELFVGLGYGYGYGGRGLDGSCRVYKDGDDLGYDDFVKARGPVVQAPGRS